MYSYLIKSVLFILVFSISSLTAQNSITGNTGTGNVTLTIDNNQTITSDASGNYSIPFSGTFDGTVVPTKEGYTFTPTFRSYVESGSRTNQNYSAKLNKYSITGNAGTGSVTLSWLEGREQKSITSKSDGSYNVTVPHGWSGAITPSKTGYIFNPINKSYSNVTANHSGQDYLASQIFTISGNCGINDATLTWENGGTQTTTSDASGNYSITIPNGWNGIVTPAKSNYTFAPLNRAYVEVGSDKINQNYTATLFKYTITTSSFPENGGTTTGNSEYDFGTTVTVEAIADDNNGYDFVNWTESNIEVSADVVYSFIVEEDRDLVANFVLRTYTLSLLAVPSDGGDVSGGGSFEHGEAIQVTASSKTGWLFANWTENGNNVSSDSIYSFTISNNKELIANFTHELYSINATSVPSEGGNISGSGTFNFGQKTTLSASTNTGYQFVNWKLNGNEVSTDSTYTLTVSGNADYIANFELKEIIINCSANPSDAGTTNGCGTMHLNDEITITAEANPDWVFTHWSDDNDTVSTSQEYVFTVLSSRNLIANFSLISGIEKLDNNDIIPQDYYLSNAYPNPFNPETNFEFGIPEESYVNLIIFNITGQIVQTVVNNSVLHAGNYINHFYADDLPSGIYLYLLSANSTISDKNFKKTGKMLLLK